MPTLTDAVRTLIDETESEQDASLYATDIANDFATSREEVLAEIRRQYGEGEEPSPTTQVLLVFDMVPTETRFYLVDADAETLELLRACHNKMGNSVADEGRAIELCEMLDKEPLRQCRLELSDVPFEVEGNVVVIYSGFLE